MLHRTGLLTEAQVQGSIAMLPVPLSTTQFYEAYDYVCKVERQVTELCSLDRDLSLSYLDIY